MATPIKLRSHKVLIKAPRELVFQMMSSIGSGRIKGDNNESSKVLCRDGNHLIAQFRTKAGPLWYTTIEEIDFEPPERITFKHLSGPLHYAWEEFVYNDVDGDTEVIHNGEFIWHPFPVIGKLAGLMYTRPAFERVIDKHMKVIKDAAEERAARSHVFPRNTEAEAPTS